MKMLSRVAKGWRRIDGGSVDELDLTRRADFESATETFPKSDLILIGMPLYADAMPSLVKEWIEALEPYVGRAGNPPIAFLVQSGFVEALHCRGVERYFEKLAERLGSPYAGTIVRGGGEALRSMPDEANKKLWAQLELLGESLARDGRFDAELLSAVAGIERFTKPQAAVLGPLLKWPLASLMWRSELKAKGGWERRHARVYARVHTKSTTL
jgi:hypothetical protein